MAVDLPCGWCGALVRRYPSQIGPRVFCGRACQGRFRSERLSGPRSPRWRDGTTRDRLRVLWHLPWHPRADRKGYVPRAIIVAELKLGRPLLPGEVVHHDDEDPSNDHPDNLVVLPSQAEHALLHGRRRPAERMAAMRAAKGAPA